MDSNDLNHGTSFRDLPRSKQVFSLTFGLASFACLLYALADILGFIKTTNPILASKEALNPNLRWFWPISSFLASVIFFFATMISLIDTSDGSRSALRRFMREMRIIR